MNSRKILLALAILALSTMFCSTADLGIPNDMMVTLTAQVPALQTELAAQLTQVALSPTAPTPAGLGSISGTLSYPADTTPAMRVVAFDATTNQPYFVDTRQGDSEYQIPEVPAGTYYVVAYTLGGSSFPAGLAGGYTAAVPCGLGQACTDHSLLPVGVETATETSGITPMDWFQGSYPPMPGAAPVVPTQAGTPATGLDSVIEGSLSYPSSFIPPLYVVAFKVGDPGEYYYVQTQQDQAAYSLPVPAGEYYVVAYVQDGDFAGAYSQAVPCGLAAGCTDHSLIAVKAASGAPATGIDPGDWYAPEGTFPPNPVK